MKQTANRKLPELLRTEAGLDRVRFSLPFGMAGLDGLRIDQPEGFTGEPLLVVEEFRLRVPPGKAVRRDPVEVRNLQISGLNFELILDTNGVMNVSRLGPPPSAEIELEAGPAETEASSLPPIWIRNLSLKEGSFAFTDLNQDWRIEVEDLEFTLRNLWIEPRGTTAPAEIRADLRLPSPRAAGQLMLRAKVGPIHPSRAEQLPSLQVAFGLFGFDLDLIEPFLVPAPAVAKAAFGGGGFDFVFFLEIGPGASAAEQNLRGSFVLETDGGQRTADQLSGTVAEPVLPFVSLFTNILGNQFGRVTRLGGNLARGGVAAGQAVADTGVTAVKGAAQTVTGLAGGLLRTAKGVVTLDSDEALGGMRDATVGTAENLGNTVTDTAGAAGSGVRDTVRTASGRDNEDAWWAGVPTRAAAFEESADAWFTQNPFPGVTP